MSSFAPLSGLVQSSVLILGLWLVLRLFPRISPDARAWLWRLAVLKLACSAVAFGTVTLHVLPGFSVSPQPRLALRQKPVRQVMTAPTIDKPSIALKTSLQSEPAHSAMRRAPEIGGSTWEIFGVAAWCGALALLCVRPVLGALNARRWLRQALPITDREILAGLEELSRNANLGRIAPLVSCEGTPSPMVYGIWKPVIILPKKIASVGGQDLKLALAHEVAHIQRKDLVWATVAWLVRSALFFNPLAWLAEAELRAAQESATDQQAVWLTGVTVSAYGEMLLRAMTPTRVSWSPSGLSMFDSYRNAYRRLGAMKHFSNPPTISRKALGAALVLAGMGCLPTYILAPARAASIPQKPVDGRRPSLDGSRLPARGGNNQVGPGSVIAPAQPALVHRPLITNAQPELGFDAPVLIMSVAPSGAGAKHISFSQSPSPSRSDPHPTSTGSPSETSGVDSLQSEDLRQAAKAAQDEFGQRVAKLIADQDERIAGYRQGADQRELEAEQREREAQQRKREGEQRARAALLREQVIEEREKDQYRLAGPGQRNVDRRQRQDDKRQQEADQYQLRIDQKQRETDQWQREFDDRTVAAMRAETQVGIAAARSEYQKRIRELVADDASRQRELTDAAAYTQDQAKLMAEAARSGLGMHVVKTGSGLSLAIPNGYEVAQMKATGNGAYTVVLNRIKE